MLTDIQNRWLSEHVYLLDSSRNDYNKTLQIGTVHSYNEDDLSLGSFKIVDIEDNTSNGMQAMAVAPIVDGKVDTSQIVIAYAGTNISDLNDVNTDIQSIGLGDTNILFKGSVHMPKTLKVAYAQPKTAMKFAEKIRKKYRNSKITTTGHSLGESLAMYVALKNGWNNVGFNGPDIS